MSQNTVDIELSRIRLKNFRSYGTLDLKISGKLIFITGQNGIGKTSILEAISMASLLRSFRAGKERDMIKWNADMFTIDVFYKDRNGEQKLHLGYSSEKRGMKTVSNRAILMNNQKVSKVADFIGRFQTVVFSPNDVEIIDTTPKQRRRFVDIMLSTLYSEYLIELQSYMKTLKMRGELLRKGTTDRGYIDAIDQELSKSGSFIQKKRSTFLQDFQIPLSKYVNQISNNKDEWVIRYQPSISDGTEINAYKAMLEANLKNDLRLRQTTRGVHRDKIFFHPPRMPHIDLMKIASQGQKRTLALALKMSQFIFTNNILNKKPILLIDDVLNELDTERRTSFIRFLNDIGQALITTTDLAGIEDYLKLFEDEVTIKSFVIENDGKEPIVKEQKS